MAENNGALALAILGLGKGGGSGTEYTAGEGIDITGTTISVDNTIARASAIPTATSDLTNDSGFITSSDLTGYATETYVDDAVADKSEVSVSNTGTSTNEVSYITVDDTEYKIAGGGGSSYTAGTNIDITNNVISAPNVLPLSGGTMTGNIKFESNKGIEFSHSPYGTGDMIKNASDGFIFVPAGSSSEALKINKDALISGLGTAIIPRTDSTGAIAYLRQHLGAPNKR